MVYKGVTIGGASLFHYGVKGMKWGVTNEDKPKGIVGSALYDWGDKIKNRDYQSQPNRRVGYSIPSAEGEYEEVLEEEIPTPQAYYPGTQQPVATTTPEEAKTVTVDGEARLNSILTHLKNKSVADIPEFTEEKEYTYKNGRWV